MTPAGTRIVRRRVNTVLPSRSRFDRILLAVLFCLGSVTGASAQPARTQGWLFGLGSGRMNASFANGPGDGAALVDLRIGYGLNRIVAPYLGMAYGNIESRGLDAFDNVTFGHLDLGVRLHLEDVRRRWVPYGDVALTVWPVRDVLRNGKRTAGFTSAPVLSAGGGLAIYLSDSWALDVNLKAGRGTFKAAPAGNTPAGGPSRRSGTVPDLDARSVRLSVGVSWWP